MSLLTPGQLLDRWTREPTCSAAGATRESRQRTLRATIEWSYELLDARQRRLLAALSIFRGGWTLAAAERVCDADIDQLQSLVEKSLVRRWESGRFGMLETIREFAAEQLLPEDRGRLLLRLLDRLIELFDSLSAGSDGPGKPQIELAQAERPNIDVALAQALERGEIAAGLALVSQLESTGATNDPLGGRSESTGCLRRPATGSSATSSPTALRIRGSTYDMTGETDRSVREFERAAEIFRSVGDDEEADHLLHRVAAPALHEGDVDGARCRWPARR